MSQSISGVIVGGGNIYSSPTTQLDDELSSTSINAVQNKVIKAELDKKVVLTGDNTLNGNNVFAEGLTEFDGQVAFNGHAEFNGALDFNVKEIQVNSDTTFNHPVVNNETVITHGEQTNQSKIIMNGGLQVNSITESGTKTLLDMGEGESITYKGSELATKDDLKNAGSSSSIDEQTLVVLACSGFINWDIQTKKSDWVIEGTTAYYIYKDEDTKSITPSNKSAICDLDACKVLKSVCGDGKITIYYPNTNIPDDGVSLEIKYI